MNNDKVVAFYTEVESQKESLQRTLDEIKTKEITIPATVNSLTVNKRPNYHLTELFGKLSISTAGYYSYTNVRGTKSDYIYKRMNFELYFQCALKNKSQQADSR